MRPGLRMVIVDAPGGLAEALGPLEPGIRWDTELSPGASGLDLILYFTTRRAALEERFDAFAGALQPAGMFWVAWPKRAARLPTDLSEDAVRRIALAHGLVDVKVCAIDATWSGLKLMYRLQDRPRG
jgi:hypothetical protein